MYIINTNLEEVTKEFDFINSWIDTLCDNILHKDRKNCKITMFYNYGYFVPKGTIKINELMITNRLKKGMVPDVIKSMVTEITKYKMSIECEFHQNEDIKNSIPEFDESVVSIEVIKQEIGTDKIEEDYFDLDDILDKIAKSGIDSLTDGEKSFLDKKSKEMYWI